MGGTLAAKKRVYHPPGAGFLEKTVRSVDLEQRKQKANKPFMMKLLPSASLTLDSLLLGLGLPCANTAPRPPEHVS